MLDLIIIGASVSGISGAIYASRRRLNFKIISKDFGGEVATSGEIENYPGFVKTNGMELTQKFREQLDAVNVDLELGVYVNKIVKQGDEFVVDAEGCKGALRAGSKVEDAGKSNGCKYEAKTVIITTGVRPRQLDIPGEKELRNKGVSYCTVCDGPLFSGKRVVTIGGGNSALESAIMLSSIASRVTLLTIDPDFTGDAVLTEKVKSLPNIDFIFNANAKRIKGEERVTGLEYEMDGNMSSLDIDAVFIHIGMVPNSQFTEAEKNDFGEIKTSRVMETNVPGLFAAGDVTDHPFKQIAIAAGQGVTAVLQAIKYLNSKNK